MNLTSYLLVLFAFRLSKAGYVVAAREISIVLSVLIGSVLMREGHFGPGLVGALVVLSASPVWRSARRGRILDGPWPSLNSKAPVPSGGLAAEAPGGFTCSNTLSRAWCGWSRPCWPWRW